MLVLGLFFCSSTYFLSVLPAIMKGSSKSCEVLWFQYSGNWENDVGKLGKRICSSIFFPFLRHLVVGEEFKPIFADPLEHWKDSESKCVSFERNFLFCKLRREGSQRGWEERGLFLEVSVNCERVLLLIHNTILDPETCQTSYMKRGKGLRRLSCVCPTEPSRTGLLSLPGQGLSGAACQAPLLRSLSVWAHSTSLPMHPPLPDYLAFIYSTWTKSGL